MTRNANHRRHQNGLGFMLVLSLLVLGTSGDAQAQVVAPSPGDVVEVREGDVWSPAEFIQKEGRRLLIRYDDGTEEWVTADRLREAGGAVADPAGERPRRFRKGQDVEFKKSLKWVPAEIKRAMPPLYLVATKEGLGSREFHWEWVNAPRLRTPGEDHEGPSMRDQFGHYRHNDSIKESLREAKAAYAEHELKESQTVRNENGKRDPFAAPPFNHPVTPADRSQMQTVSVGGGSWAEAVVDPGEPVPAAVRHQTIKTKSQQDSVFARPKMIDASGRFALMAINEESPRKAKHVGVERFDLWRGRSLGTASFDIASLPLAISPDGNLIFGRADGRRSGDSARLDVWDASRGEPTHVVSFVLAGEASRGAGDVASAAFAGPDTLVVRTRGGDVSAWEARTGRGLWEAEGLGGTGRVMAVSPGGAVVAVAGRGELFLLDAATGRVRATLPSLAGGLTALRFSEDGRYLAAANSDRVQAWDLQDRRAMDSVGVLPGPQTMGLIVQNDGLVIWRGQTRNALTGAAGERYVLPGWAVTETQGSRLLGLIQSGRDEPRELCVWSFSETQNQKPDIAEPAFVFSSGDPVQIDASRLEGSAELRESIIAAMKALVEARGAVLADSSDTVLRVETTTKSEQQIYETDEIAPWHRTQNKVRVETKITRLALEVEGQTAWQKTVAVSADDRVARAEGQSMQSAVDASIDRDAGAKWTQQTLTADAVLPDLIPDPRRFEAGVVRLEPGGFAP